MSKADTNKDVQIKILSQFTTQDPELVLMEINREPQRINEKPPFLVNHSQAGMFYRAYTYIQNEIVYPHLQKARPWDPDNEYLVRLSHELIVRCLEKDLRILTNDLDIGFITALSGEKQEKRSVKDTSVAIVPYAHCLNMASDHVLLRFEEHNRRELQISKAHAVRKQLDLAKDASLAVCKIPGCQGYRTFGVITQEAAACYPQFKLNSYLCWSLCMPGPDGKETTVLRYHRGSLMMPAIDLEQAHYDSLKAGVQKCGIRISEDEAGYVAKLAQLVTKCDHGAVIILARETDMGKEAKRLTEKNRGMQLGTPITINQDDGEPDTVLLSRLSSVDGAILADFQGQCHAYGVILDGTVTQSGNPDRGSRLNSTKTYIENRFLGKNGQFDAAKPPFFGIVFSDDGMVNICWGQGVSGHDRVGSGAAASGGKCLDRHDLQNDF